MDQEGWARRWQVASERVLSGMRDWEAAHPAATFAEMEAEVEAQLARLRVQLLEDLAVARAARERQAPERPACPGPADAAPAAASSSEPGKRMMPTTPRGHRHRSDHGRAVRRAPGGAGGP